MEFTTLKLNFPEGANLILGQTHFIKTVEDFYEIMTGISSQVKFGITFCEASGECLIRKAGRNDPKLIELAIAGYLLRMRSAFLQMPYQNMV